MTSPLSRHLRMIADGLPDQHEKESVISAADLLDAKPAASCSAAKTWCPGCSREVDGVCHHFNCAIGPNGLAARGRSSAGSADEPEAICGNCDSWKEDLQGNHHCLNAKSNLELLLTDFNDHCSHFFPDPTRWPDADHD